MSFGKCVCPVFPQFSIITSLPFGNSPAPPPCFLFWFSPFVFPSLSPFPFVFVFTCRASKRGQNQGPPDRVVLLNLPNCDAAREFLLLMRPLYRAINEKVLREVTAARIHSAPEARLVELQKHFGAVPWFTNEPDALKALKFVRRGQDEEKFIGSPELQLCAGRAITAACGTSVIAIQSNFRRLMGPFGGCSRGEKVNLRPCGEAAVLYKKTVEAEEEINRSMISVMQILSIVILITHGKDLAAAIVSEENSKKRGRATQLHVEQNLVRRQRLLVLRGPRSARRVGTEMFAERQTPEEEGEFAPLWESVEKFVLEKGIGPIKGKTGGRKSGVMLYLFPMTLFSFFCNIVCVCCAVCFYLLQGGCEAGGGDGQPKYGAGRAAAAPCVSKKWKRRRGQRPWGCAGVWQ